ncbi:allene oxide cyclase barrel-like domain-containing protein [Kitasatospora sp. NPDC001175]|uniref:allene oxide cyclase barrel-like domain-containing protein n=1 Tax=Kitasatospora sp. NPDC001175 TaxID=3157103 RepID=UPI003CFDFCFB
MRRYKALGSVAGTALAAVLACAPLAHAAAPVPDTLGGDGKGKVKVIKLVALLRQAAGIPVDGGLSLGDRQVGNDELFQNGNRVGSDGFVCTVTSLSPDERECEITLHLPKGDIAIQGLAPVIQSFPTDFTLAITGGTGVYKNARGFVTGTNVNATETDLTLHLT